MRAVIWTDENGYLHRSLIRDDDQDYRAAEVGIPTEPPDVCLLDYSGLEIDVDEFQKALHNQLVRLGLITWKDVQRSQNGVTRAIMAAGKDRKILLVLKRQLVTLYKLGG
jgi:hypothetical protein